MFEQERTETGEHVLACECVYVYAHFKLRVCRLYLLTVGHRPRISCKRGIWSLSTAERDRGELLGLTSELSQHAGVRERERVR